MRALLIVFVFSFVLPVTAAAVTGDFDGDGAVELPDLITFSGDWLSESPADPNTDLDGSGVVDMNDFAELSRAWWVGHTNQTPTAAAIIAGCYPGQSTPITLAGSDTEAGTLTYSLTGRTSQGVMIRRSPGVYTYYAHQTASGNDIFQYTVSDGALTSAAADVNVVIYTAPLETIAFAGRSSVVIPDDETVDIDDLFTLCFWFRTRWPEGALFAKRGAAGGPGVVIEIEAGRPVTHLYGQDGAACVLRGDDRVDDGLWWYFGLTYDADGSISLMTAEITAVMYLACGEVSDGRNIEMMATGTSAGMDMTNTADAVFGRYGNRMFYGQIDTMSNYAAAQGSLGLAIVWIEGRDGVATVLSSAYYRRFLYNEGTGLTVLDTTGTVAGSLTNHSRTIWADEFTPVDERYRQRGRVRGIDGAMMLPDYRRKDEL
jgi:hypothetical protein